MVSIRKKRIGFVAYRKELETNIKHISRIASMHDHDVTTFIYSNEDDAFLRKTANLREFCIYIPAKCNRFLARVLFILRVARVSKRLELDVLHIESSCRYFFLFKLLIPSAKCIYHALSYPMYNQHWRVVGRQLSVLLQSFFMNTVIIQSEEQKEKWIGLRQLQKTKIVPVGYDAQLFYPVQQKRKMALRKLLGVRRDRNVIIYSGAMKSTRGLDKLLEAIASVKRQHADVLLMMVGDDTQAANLKRLVSDLNLQQHVRFTGKIPHRRMVDYYGVADIGVSLIPINRRFNRNPPLKTYEYLACGLACVATATLSNMQVIENGKNGVLVKDTSMDVAGALVDLLNDSKKREALGNSAKKSVKRYTFDKITKWYVLPIYEAITE